MSSAKNTNEFSAVEQIAQLFNSSLFENVTIANSSLVCVTWEDPKANIKDVIVNLKLYKVIKSNALAAKVLEMHINNMNSYKALLLDDDYNAYSLFIKYEY